MRACLCLCLSLAVTGCASRAANHVTPELVEPTTGDRSVSLKTFMAKVRRLSVEAAARRPTLFNATLESTDPDLSAALAVATVAPTPASLRDVADAYGRRGVFDKAHEYLQAALRLDRRDAATYEALARLWRDARLPHLAVSDANRAVYYAPTWAVARNTLGTVLQALGQRSNARNAFSRTLELDPSAAYALSNLCYGWILDGQANKALQACQSALRIDPTLRAARNNLGLAQASLGDVTAARESFKTGSEEAGALFNMGMAHLAYRDYASAVKAFEAAQTLRPSMRLAHSRAQEARTRASGEARP